MKRATAKQAAGNSMKRAAAASQAMKSAKCMKAASGNDGYVAKSMKSQKMPVHEDMSFNNEKHRDGDDGASTAAESKNKQNQAPEKPEKKTSSAEDDEDSRGPKMTVAEFIGAGAETKVSEMKSIAVKDAGNEQYSTLTFTACGPSVKKLDRKGVAAVIAQCVIHLNAFNLSDCCLGVWMEFEGDLHFHGVLHLKDDKRCRRWPDFEKILHNDLKCPWYFCFFFSHRK